MVDKTVIRLIQSGEINQQHLQAALEEQQVTKESLVAILVKKGFITEARVKEVLELSDEDINIREIQVSPGVLKMLPVHIIRNNKVFPLKFENNKFVLAMVNPKDLMVRDTISIILGKSIALNRFKISDEDFYFLTSKYSHILGDIREKEHSDVEKHEEAASYEIKDDGTSNPVVRLINKLLSSAYQKRVSLITVEPGSDHVRIRFKIDDTFYEEIRLPKKMYPNFLSYIKQLSGLESEENSFYYFGNFRFAESDKKEINFVVNGIKTINGEKLIIRPGFPIPDLKTLFYYPEIYDYLNTVTINNKGMILVIGGSGSGKSTTLYSFLQHKISNRYQLMTIENPVKYVFENYVTQIQLKMDTIISLSDLESEVGKHNPDVIMVQEIKDELWGNLIEELALSGMLVLTSMKAYNTISALKRLKRINYPNFASIQCIINQKLLKKLCPNCRIIHVPSSEELQLMRSNIEQIPESYHALPSGCSKCIGGYRGLIGVFEVIKVNRELVDLYENNEYFGANIGKTINESCIMTFKEYCKKLLIDGIISFEEIKKLT